ncbi:hypothetical protein ACDW_23020 [Acidovorax sp. DW039]|uniref:hypothetical protein n=1 Tax=Acidovorax sp. DW039 TaxID=3095606 RepID=UPI003090500C|nr:hypothetical protein ACDW_23020 [Acidovorax sp. DW039]
MDETTITAKAHEVPDPDWEKRSATLYRAWVQVRYHRRRQRFFDTVDKSSKALTAMLGGASIIGARLKEIEPLVGPAIALLSLLSLVYVYSDRKQTHKELAEQFAGVIAAIEQTPEGTESPQDVAKWASEYAKVVAKCPPALKTLTIICEQEQSISQGSEPALNQPGLLARMFANFF